MCKILDFGHFRKRTPSFNKNHLVLIKKSVYPFGTSMIHDGICIKFQFHFWTLLNLTISSQVKRWKIQPNKKVESFIFDQIWLNKGNIMEMRHFTWILAFVVVALNGRGKLTYDDHSKSFIKNSNIPSPWLLFLRG